jgi:hypothetical protein
MARSGHPEEFVDSLTGDLAIDWGFEEFGLTIDSKIEWPN